MAEASIFTTQFTILFLVCSSLAISPPNAKETDHFAETMDMKLLGLKGEKLSHFKLYWHDVVTGPSPSSIQIVPPQHNTSRTGFGCVRMIDSPLTIGPELSSKMVGKAQGFYAQASQEEIGLLMALNFAFTEGKYNGSTITFLGRNTMFSKVREMPVIGGSGVFRFAGGYVRARTHNFDVSKGDAMIEYNVHVLHSCIIKESDPLSKITLSYSVH